MPEQSSPQPKTPLADHDLLRRFVRDSDEAAFADIVHRYQTLVMGVCRKVTATSQDAEDAFQAVFVTLARRPHSIRYTKSLSSWLYTVAWRTSMRLVRRQRKLVMDPLNQPIENSDPDPLDQIALHQQADLLHEELNLLPERYRQVLVMTYFAQQTSQQIADQLQLTKGTVDGRIRQARNVLRVRLARRGVALSVLLAVSATLQTSATAAVTPQLLDTTLQLGTQTLKQSLPDTTDLSHLESLIRPEILTMNLKLLTALSAGAVLLVTAAGMTAAPGDNSTDGSTAAPAIVAGTAADSDVEVPSPAVRVAPLAPAATGSNSRIQKADTMVLNGNTIPPAPPAEIHSVSSVASPPTAPDGKDWQTVKHRRLLDRLQQLHTIISDPRDLWLTATLNQPVPLLEYPGEASLREILDYLAEHFTETYGGILRSDPDGPNHRMTIWPAAVQLQAAGYDDLDDVRVADIELEGATLEQALTLIFERTDNLTWVVRNGALEVTTTDAVETDDRYQVTRRIPVSDEDFDLQLLQRHMEVRGVFFSTDEETFPQDHAGWLSMKQGALIATHNIQALHSLQNFLDTIVTAPLASASTAVPQSSPSRLPQGLLPFPADGNGMLFNLSGDRMTRFLRMEIHVQVGAEDHTVAKRRLSALDIELKSWLNSRMADLSLDDIRGSAGQQKVASLIRNHFATTVFPDDPGKIQQVLFPAFQVQ